LSLAMRFEKSLIWILIYFGVLRLALACLIWVGIIYSKKLSVLL
jgi:hypothetical protein